MEKNPLPPNPPSPTAGKRATAAKTAAGQPRTNATPEFEDDDPNQTPTERFTGRLFKRHGPKFDVQACIASIRKQLEKCTV
jgi:hypothetical protein